MIPFSTVLDKAFDLAMYGSPVQAKYAATFLTAVPDNEEQCEELVKVSRDEHRYSTSVLTEYVLLQNLADALPVSSGDRLISHLNALKRLAKYSIDAFETRAREITSFATAQLKRPTLTSTPSKGSNAVSREFLPAQFQEPAYVIICRVLVYGH